MIGTLVIGENVGNTHIRFININDYEYYINSIDQGYDSEDAIYNGYVYILNMPDFNRVNRSQYGNGCDCKHQIVEYQGNNLFKPTKGYCFVKCNIFLTGRKYKQQCLALIRNKKRRCNILIVARIHSF